MSDPQPRLAPLAQALGTVPSGFFVATAGVGAESTGMLVSFVQQAGFVPPCISIALKPGRPMLALVRASRRFCLSVIDDASVALLGHFARGFDPGKPAFTNVNTALDDAGVPYLVDALAWMSCRVVGEVTWSDHVIVCGEVLDGRRRDSGQPMVHVRKNGLGY